MDDHSPAPLPLIFVATGLLDEYDHYLALLARLTADDDRRLTRCAGWTVHDVVAHVVGLASDAFTGRIGRFTPDQHAEMRRDVTVDDLVDELEQVLQVARPFLGAVTEDQWSGPSGAPSLTLGDGILTLWFDAWVHRDDVSAALGARPDVGPGLAAAVTYVRQEHSRRGWRAPVGVDVHRLDPHALVLAATGRSDPVTVGLDGSVNLYRRA